MIAGTGIAVAGLGGEVGGLALDATGVGVIGGVPLAVASAGAVIYGGTVINRSASNFGQDAKDLFVEAKTQGHHSDPKYLGGNPEQKLTDLETQDHIDIHKEIDNKYPRYKGKNYYDKLRDDDPGFDGKVQKDISDTYNKYSEKYPNLTKDYDNNFNERK